MTPRILCADAVLPGEERPIRDGAVVVDDDGTVLEVGTADVVLSRHVGASIERIAGVLLPGLINAHTHIELSGLRGRITGGNGFVPWVDRLIGIRAAEHPEDDAVAIENAVLELDRAGTVAVGEVSNTLAAVHALARHGIGGVIFHEVLGVDRQMALDRVTTMEGGRASREQSWPTQDLAYAPALHTLYTTHPDAIRRVLAMVRERGARTTIHLAEHPAERIFLLHGTGPYLDFATRMRLPIEAFPVPRKGPIEAAAELGLVAPDVLLVHLTDVRAAELDRVAASGAPVVLCPRSNLFIEVRLPPLVEMLQAGVMPALGTDSLASNLSLDLLSEAKALADRFPSVPKGKLIEMATASGARALGRSDLGRLQKGLRPGVIAVTGQISPLDDPCAWVLRQPLTARRWAARRTVAGHQRGTFA